MSEERPAISTRQLSPAEIARRSFTSVRRGFDPEEVRAYLELVADELVTAEQREEELLHELEAAEDQALHPDIDEATLTAALGQRSAAVLRNAHDAAGRITEQAEATAAATVREAHQQATEVQVQAEAAAAERIAEAEILANTLQQQARHEAAGMLEATRAECDALVERAREQGRMMLEQAQEARRRVLADMAHRRRAMAAQVDQYRAARDAVAAAVTGARQSVDRVLDDLARADDAAKAAAAEVAQHPPFEPTTHGLVAEAEQAAAELGVPTGSTAELAVPTGSAADLDVPTGSAADLDVTAQLSIDDIRTVVPPRGDRYEGHGEMVGTASPEAGAAPVGAVTFEGGENAAYGLAEPSAGDGGLDAGAATGPDAGGAGRALPAFVFDDVGDAPGGGELLGVRPSDEGDAVEGQRPGGEVFDVEAFERESAEAAGEPAASAEEGAGAPGEDQPADRGTSGGAGAEGGVEPGEDGVEGLFARLRASHDALGLEGEQPPRPSSPRGRRDGGPAPGAEGAESDVAATPATESSGEGPDATEPQDGAPPAAVTGVTAESTAAETALTRRSELLDPVTAVLARRLKRSLQDDQNHLLERLRGGSGDWSDTLLPEEDEQRALYVGAALPHVRDAVAAGITFARSIGRRPRGKAPAPDEATVRKVADELGGTVVTLLRRRLTSDAAGDSAERVGAAYREWRGERIERLVGDCAVEAFSAGVLAAVPAGTGIRWLRNESSLGCADCEDNALGDAVSIGADFPTGHRHPPAHAGCRCLVLPTPA